MWLSYYCSCIVDFCVDKHNYRHIVNFKDHVHAESIPREEEQENHVYTIKLNLKYTVLSQKIDIKNLKNILHISRILMVLRNIC